MKKIFFLAICTSLLEIGYSQSEKVADDFRKLAWLGGTWVRTNAQTNETGNERWVKMSGSEWQGFGLTMKGQDTVSLERLKLIIKDDAIYYVADVPENKQAVYFKLTEVSDNRFVVENPEHAFPKKISYLKDGDKFRVTLFDDTKSVDYFFQRK
jgi:hypothetical protein